MYLSCLYSGVQVFCSYRRVKDLVSIVKVAPIFDQNVEIGWDLYVDGE